MIDGSRPHHKLRLYLKPFAGSPGLFSRASGRCIAPELMQLQRPAIRYTSVQPGCSGTRKPRTRSRARKKCQGSVETRNVLREACLYNVLPPTATGARQKSRRRRGDTRLCAKFDSTLMPGSRGALIPREARFRLELLIPSDTDNLRRSITILFFRLSEIYMAEGLI